MDKRIRLLPFLFVFLATVAVSGQEGVEKPVVQGGNASGDYTLAELRHDRQAAARSKRRIIYNNDGNESFRHVKSITAKGLLAPRTLGIENSQVDAIFYCTSHAWGTFNHDTKIGSLLDVKEEPGKATLFGRNVTRELIDAGLDPLKVMVEFGHAHKKEVFWSMRMNDTHDGGKKGYGPVLFKANKIKNAHPEYLVAAPFVKGAGGSWSAVNYAIKEVRDYTAAFLQEVCQNYDVDGIELDFFRHRVFFKTTFNGLPVTASETAAMTELMRRLRAITEEEGLKRKRPFLISVRVPDSREYARNIGLDIEKWLEEGLVDMMVVSGYIHLNDWEKSVELGHRYGVPVYPSLDESRIGDAESKALRNKSSEAYRGRALQAWNAGADGIYIFNFFNPKSEIWHELGDPEELAKMKKRYFVSVRGSGKSAGLPHADYQNIPILNPDSPLKVSQGESARTYIVFAEDPSSHTAVRLRLRFKDPVKDKMLSVQVNGHPLRKGKTENDWISFDVKHTFLVKGKNHLAVSSTEKSSGELVWTDAYLEVVPENTHRN